MDGIYASLTQPLRPNRPANEAVNISGADRVAFSGEVVRNIRTSTAVVLARAVLSAGARQADAGQAFPSYARWLTQRGFPDRESRRHPAAHGFIGDRDSALGQQILDVTKAEGEPEIERDR
jgi:hypothetical protein